MTAPTKTLTAAEATPRPQVRVGNQEGEGAASRRGSKDSAAPVMRKRAKSLIGADFALHCLHVASIMRHAQALIAT